MRDNKDDIRVLLYSYSTTITGWGVVLRFTVRCALPDSHRMSTAGEEDIELCDLQFDTTLALSVPILT